MSAKIHGYMERIDRETEPGERSDEDGKHV